MSIYGVTGYLFKVFRRSYIFLFGLLATMFFSTSTFIGTIKVGEDMGKYLKMQEFGLLTIVCVVSAINIFNFNIENSEFEYLIKDRFKYFIAGTIGSILVGLTLSIIPFIYILSFIFMNDFSNIGAVFIEFIFIYLQAIIIMASMSTILCFLLKGLLKRLISISLTILLMSSVFEMLLSKIFFSYSKILSFIVRTLNVHDDFDLTRYSEFFGFTHGIDFFIDKIMIILIVLGVFYCIFKKERKLKYKSKDFIIGTTGLAFILGLGYISYNSYSFNSGGYIEPIIEKSSYEVEEYNMDLSLNSKLESEVSMNLNFEQSEEICKLYLSELFEVDKVLVNGKDTIFTRDFDVLNIEFEKPLSGQVKIDIVYDGRVNELSELKTIESIVSKKKIYLSNEMIDWYPRLKDGKESEFTINLDSENILSNLDGKNGVLKGASTEVVLIKGNLEKINIEGYDIYTTNKKHLDRDIESFKYMLGEHEEKEELIKDIKERKEIILSDVFIFKVLEGMVIN